MSDKGQSSITAVASCDTGDEGYLVRDGNSRRFPFSSLWSTTITPSYPGINLSSGAVINWNSGDVTLTHAANTLTFAGASSGYLFDAIVAPSSNDGSVLGTTSLGWADLFLADGGVINWGAGGVTATHAAASDSLTLALDASNLLASTTLTLAVDGTSLVALAGTALSPATNDAAALGTTAFSWSDLFLADGGVVNWGAGGVTITHTAASDSLAIALDAANGLGSTAFTIAIDGTTLISLAGTALSPATNDVAALGTATLMWSDLFLASGAVLNFNAGDVTVTHSTDTLTVAGGVLAVRPGQTNVVSISFFSDSYFIGMTGGTLKISTATNQSLEHRVNDLLSTTISPAGIPGLGITAGDGSGEDVILRRDAANVLAIRNATAAQTLRGYYSFTDASNYQRWALNTAATSVELAAETAGTGADNIDVKLTPAGTGAVLVTTAASPVSSDGATLGSTSLMWADLFLADGGVINWGNGGVTLTHTAASDSLILALDAGNLLASTLFTIALDGANELVLSAAALYPATDDGLALGITNTNQWADIFLAPGAVINWSNGDVTLTHSTNALAFAGVTSGYSFDDTITITDATNPLRLVNNTDGASVQVARLEGDRATMADNDEAYASLLLSNDGGTQTEFARLTWVATDVNAATSVDGALYWSVAVAGTLIAKVRLEDSVLSPSASDGTALGSTSLMWADLFLASGGVLNFNNGDVTVTHSANLLAFAGAASGYAFDAPVLIGSTTSLALSGPTVDNLQVLGTSPATAGLMIAMFNTSASLGPRIDFYRSKNATIHTATVVASGDVLGALNFYAAQQTGTLATQTLGVQIRAEVDGTVTSGASGDMPGRIVWATTADGGASPTDRLILDSAGILKPNANDGVALGTATLSYADLFLASGAVLNFNNGDVTATHASNALTWAGAASGWVFNDGNMYIGDTANTSQTLGLTINQGAADNEILALKSSDVAHGLTAQTETDTYGAFAKASAANGGLVIRGFATTTVGNVGINIRPVGPDDTTKSTAGLGMAIVDAFANTGTGDAVAPAANSNLFAVRTAGTTRFILDADGDSHQDVGTAWTNFHGHDDMTLVAALAANVTRPDDPIRHDFGDWLFQRRKELERLRLVIFNDDGHHFVNMSRLTMLLVGAIQQIAARFEEVDADMASMRKALAA